MRRFFKSLSAQDKKKKRGAVHLGALAHPWDSHPMARLPLSGVTRRSPLGSGGEDPAHPLALRLSEGAVGWAGPPPLPRALGTPSKVLGGGFRTPSLLWRPPLPLGSVSGIGTRGARAPRRATPLYEGGAIVWRGRWYPGGRRPPGALPPFWGGAIERSGRFQCFRGDFCVIRYSWYIGVVREGFTLCTSGSFGRALPYVMFMRCIEQC